MLQIERYREAIIAVCDDLSLARLDIVGSAVRNDFSDTSDVDVLVDFGNNDRLFDRYFDLKERLEDVFQRPVDVIEDRAVKNPYFRRMLDRNRLRVYGT
ncbi:MAG: nucleotidyltransferase domain-containing protein [Acidobacteria bacterium]|nr:nucleotidyltransferase domain-containing protein [Acidobacteriota bacterium]